MKFTVTITRTSVASIDVEIDDPTITTSKQAVRKALDEAGDQDFTSCAVEYQFGCDGVDPNDGTWDSWDQGDEDDEDGESGDPADQFMQIAEDMVRGTGNPDAEEKCAICNKAVLPDSLPEAIDAGWFPSYFEGQNEMSGPVCPRCIEQFLVDDGSGDDVLAIDGEYVSVWDGGQEIRTKCRVSPVTRELISESSVEVKVNVLDREYVVLNGKEYAARNQEEWGEYSAVEQSKMFWWS